MTACVAVLAALLGAGVGGYASFKGSDALESKRRTARSMIRRKAKVYTPIREELIELRESQQIGRIYNYWGIQREEVIHQI
jgi:hypothetical protein